MRAKRRYTQLLRQRWLRDYENLVLVEAPELRQRADFWDTAIHLFNQGLSPARAANQWIENRQGETQS